MKTIAAAMFIIAHIMRHHSIPANELTAAVVELTWQESLANMPGNAWRWAE